MNSTQQQQEEQEMIAHIKLLLGDEQPNLLRSDMTEEVKRLLEKTEWPEKTKGEYLKNFKKHAEESDELGIHSKVIITQLIWLMLDTNPLPPDHEKRSEQQQRCFNAIRALIGLEPEEGEEDPEDGEPDKGLEAAEKELEAKNAALEAKNAALEAAEKELKKLESEVQAALANSATNAITHATELQIAEKKIAALRDQLREADTLKSQLDASSIKLKSKLEAAENVSADKQGQIKDLEKRIEQQTQSQPADVPNPCMQKFQQIAQDNQTKLQTLLQNTADIYKSVQAMKNNDQDNDKHNDDRVLSRAQQSGFRINLSGQAGKRARGTKQPTIKQKQARLKL
jgi:chromosome segregation ATPase